MGSSRVGCPLGLGWSGRARVVRQTTTQHRQQKRSEYRLSQAKRETVRVTDVTPGPQYRVAPQAVTSLGLPISHYQTESHMMEGVVGKLRLKLQSRLQSPSRLWCSVADRG